VLESDPESWGETDILVPPTLSESRLYAYARKPLPGLGSLGKAYRADGGPLQSIPNQKHEHSLDPGLHRYRLVESGERYTVEIF
jgi:hypothetical protein